MARALSKTVARWSFGNRRSFTAVPPYPTLSMSTWPAYEPSNLVIMAYLRMCAPPATVFPLAEAEVGRGKQLPAIGTIGFQEATYYIIGERGRRMAFPPVVAYFGRRGAGRSDVEDAALRRWNRSEDPIMDDILIHGGQVIDGSGAPGCFADVIVTDG